MSGDENDPSAEPLRKHGGLHQIPLFAMCNYPALLTGGILRLEELQDSPIEDYPAEVFFELVESYPSLLDCLTNGEEEDIIRVGELMGKGTLKSAVLEWLLDCGFNHEVTGALLCLAGLDWLNVETKQSLKSGETVVCGDQWPMFLYAGYVYDPENPWTGLLRSEILIFISSLRVSSMFFTSPSSVDREPKATHSRNAYLHGMKSVTKGSLAYIAMQVRFSLSSSSVFSHTDMVTDSKNFYHSILDLLEDPDESQEVIDLMICVFPNSSSLQRGTSKNSTLSKIWEKCAVLQEQAVIGTT
ncbi:hypothetical protein BDR05DRAFT_978646 [Suillus weaverae]|nr:hypothetical protein BDR05DRAFT_978646 [Suillus weaverae]